MYHGTLDLSGPPGLDGELDLCFFGHFLHAGALRLPRGAHRFGGAGGGGCACARRTVVSRAKDGQPSDTASGKREVFNDS